MSNNDVSASGGIGFAGLLTIVFVTLKLTGVIDWSWLWVLAPLWLGAAIVAGILLIVGVIGLSIYLWVNKVKQS